MNLKESLQIKLEAGEITQEEYDKLIMKLTNLDLLNTSVDGKSESKQKSWKIAGARSYKDSQTADEPVIVAGRLDIDGDLACPELSVSGAITINGNLQVLEKTKANGSVVVSGDAKFGGSVKVSGKLNIANNTYFTDSTKVSGKITSGGDIISGGDIKVAGKIKSLSVKSKGTMKISGVLHTEEDVVCQRFISSGGRSIIKGNLDANEVEIAKKYREKFTDTYEYEDEADNIDSLPDLGRFITRIVKNIIPDIFSSGFGSNSIPKIFEIQGDVRGELVDISYCHVFGDIIGEDVILGPQVTVDGKILYRQSLSVPQGTEYNFEQIIK